MASAHIIFLLVARHNALRLNMLDHPPTTQQTPSPTAWAGTDNRLRTALFMAAKAEFDAALTVAMNASARHFGLTGVIEDWHAEYLETMVRQLRDGCERLSRKPEPLYTGEERRLNSR